MTRIEIPRRGASVVPICLDPLRLLWVQRNDDAPALGGFHVGPGGLLDEGEAPEPAALRELFEEAGLLHADGANGIDDDTKEALRTAFMSDPAEGRRRFSELGLRWRTEDLTSIGRWVTPSYARRRFDVELYLLTLPLAEPPDPTVFELQDAEWITPEAAYQRWASGGALITPALAHFIRTLKDMGPDVASLRAVHGAAGQECLRWEVAPFVQMMPVRTPTLPPATHTNAYLVGSGEAVVIEPATPYPEEQDRFFRWVEESRRQGIRPIAMIATHHHADHVGGAAALGSRLGLPLWAHEETAARLPKLTFERHLSDGEVIALDGPTPLTLEVLHTPGHAQGHLCLLEPKSRLMIVGDMVASIGTILVEPHDGDMALYLEQLARLRDVGASMLLPAHGWPIRDPRGHLSHYITHRLEREAKVLSALGASPMTAGELVPTVYDDAPKAVWPLAALATEAHLLKLEREGRAEQQGAAWVRVSAGPS